MRVRLAPIDPGMEGEPADTTARVMAMAMDEPLELFLMDKFILHRGSVQDIPFPAVRLTYVFYMLRKINKLCDVSELGKSFVDTVCQLMTKTCSEDEAGRVIRAFDRAFSSSDAVLAACQSPGGEDGEEGEDADAVERACLTMSRKLKYVPDRAQMRLFKHLERLTRGQSGNALWHALRIDTISATKFYKALMFGTSMLNVEPWNGSRGFSDGVRFGVEHERVIKVLLEIHVMNGREPVRGGMGLLIDPTSGLLGASIDMCFGVEKTGEDDLFTVKEGSTVFEIKCRYKYLCERSSPGVSAILTELSESSVIQFLLSHPIPGVEYRASGDMPSNREFLLSRDTRFRTKKRSRPGRAPDMLKPFLPDLLYINESEMSEVIIFDTKEVGADATINDARRARCENSYVCSEEPGHSDPDSDTPDLIERLCVFEKRRFSLPIFVNPRHQYYFQSLIQQYVLSQYYIRDHSYPEYIDHRDLPKSKLVSAVLRKRDPEEVGRDLQIGRYTFDCEHVPLFIIVTPVNFDPAFTRNAITCVLNNWERETYKRTNLPIWVPNAVNEYVVSSVPRPRTP